MVRGRKIAPNSLKILFQRTKGGKKKNDGLDNNVDGEDSFKDCKESENGSGVIEEKTKSAKNPKNNKRRNFNKNRQKRVSQSARDASDNDQNNDASSSPSSKDKSAN